MSSYAQLISDTASGVCKYSIMDGSTALEATTARYCGRLQKTGKPFHTRGVSFIVPKKWPHYEQLRVGQIKAVALHPKSSIHTYMERRSGCQAESSRVRFSHLRVFFAVAYIACLVLLVYSIYDRHRGQEPAASGEDGEPVSVDSLKLDSFTESDEENISRKFQKGENRA